MPSKKRKYNARFPAGRIKKIMQTDEEVGKVAQAVPIIISRTLELFVESLLGKAMQVTMQRNAKTLSPSHVKQCILAESRFDFLRDLVKNIPDVTAAEEKEMMSREGSPNSTRVSDTTAPRRVVREDSNSSSSSDVRVQATAKDNLRRAISLDTDRPKNETITSEAIDLTKKLEGRPIVTANFYQETQTVDVEVQHKSVITLNPTYASPQPSTSHYAGFKRVMNRSESLPYPPVATYVAPSKDIAPILNIDFSKNLAVPEIKVLDTAVASIVGVPKEEKKLHRQNSKKSEVKKIEIPKPLMPPRVDIDHLNSGNLQIDEDYDT
nr:dr1-associated corepressor homolog [Maniola hyperantus]